jgi:hypothetical protein
MWHEILETFAGQGQIYPELWVYIPWQRRMCELLILCAVVWNLGESRRDMNQFEVVVARDGSGKLGQSSGSTPIRVCRTRTLLRGLSSD